MGCYLDLCHITRMCQFGDASVRFILQPCYSTKNPLVPQGCVLLGVTLTVNEPIGKFLKEKEVKATPFEDVISVVTLIHVLSRPRKSENLTLRWRDKKQRLHSCRHFCGGDWEPAYTPTDIVEEEKKMYSHCLWLRTWTQWHHIEKGQLELLFNDLISS